MTVDVMNLNYVPTLSIRASEMNGLERLPAATKDRLQPVFLLAPWPNAGELSRATDRIQKAFPHRPFFLDIDRDYLVTNDEAFAQQQWMDLQDPSGNYSNWVGFIETIPLASPCIQVLHQTRAQLVDQILMYQGMGRTFAFRLELNRLPVNIDDVTAAINEVGSADYAVIVDAGWLADTQPARLRVGNLIRTQLANIDANVPVVVSYTTIPKGYANVEGVDFAPFDNRLFVDELKQLTNRQRIIYGDWGSTRPRTHERSGPPKPRVDLAVRNGWLSARNKDEDWGFRDAAAAILESNEWKQQIDGLGIWGEVMIRQTAVNPSLGINSASKNVSARVNIHLHIQSFFNDGDIRGIDLDETWED